MIKYLHVRGADIAIADQYGVTPLHLVIQMCCHEEQQQHQQNGIGDVGGDMVDSTKTRVNVLRAVLTRTEMIDSLDQHRRTPLIWAATCGNAIFYSCTMPSICC